ncbi:hypothetical protein ACFLY5_00310 [Patescibacteria group bacterium]
MEVRLIHIYQLFCFFVVKKKQILYNKGMVKKGSLIDRIGDLANKTIAANKKRSKAAKKKTVSGKRKLKNFIKRKKVTSNTLEFGKHDGNPIITPQPYHSWESKATFNPAALYSEGKVHLLYRAIGDDDISVLGYVSSGDAFSVDERQTFPAYIPPAQDGHFADRYSLTHISSISYLSGGGGNGGCEDPRLVLIDDMVYMTYTAFDGWGSLRMALTSISINDFLKKKWNWKKPVLISKPGEIHKNWVLFPEKVNGKYAILHCVCPDVLVEYFDDLDFENREYIESCYRPRDGKQECWDNWIRGAGPPPIKTKEGWLLIYHAMDRRDPNRYKMGAMLLDINNPSKILYRTNKPFLEPDEWYENEGLKAGVSYCCGAIVKDGELIIYYGGADMVSCVAKANLDEFLDKMIQNVIPTMKHRKIKSKKLKTKRL